MKYRLITFIALLVTTVTAIVPGCSRSGSQVVADNPKSATADGGKSPRAPSAGPPALVKVEAIKKDVVTPKFLAVGNVRPVRTSIVASGADGIVDIFSVKMGDYVVGEEPPTEEDVTPAAAEETPKPEEDTHAAEEVIPTLVKDPPTVLSQLKMTSAKAELAEQRAVFEERQAALEEIRSPRSEDIDEARARQQSAEVAYATSKRRLAEMTALGERGAANPTEVKDAQENLDAAEQNRLAAAAVLARISAPRGETVLQAQARLEAQQEHVNFLEAELEKRTTVAPFDGFVVEEHTNKGQWLSKGDPVVTLADLKCVEVEVQVDQQYIDQIHPKSPVTLKIQGTGLSREWIVEKLTVVPRSNWKEGSRSFPVILVIKNKGFFDKDSAPIVPPTPALREGMMAEAEFSGKEEDAIMVPKDSIVRTSRGNFIYVINPPTEEKSLSVRQVEVTLGIGSDTWIQVTGENLEAGMQVVTEGAPRMRPFQPVQIGKNEESETSN